MAFKINTQNHQYLVKCLTSIDQIKEIENEWKHLEKNHGGLFIYFQSFDWCYHWCLTKENIPDDKHLLRIRVYVAYRDDELVFIMPMMIEKSHFGIDCLTLLSEPHGQYSNVICNEELVPLEIGKQIWSHIKSDSKASVITLSAYPQNSYFANIISGGGIVERSEKKSSILDLNTFDSWDDYQASLDNKLRKSRRKIRNKIAKKGKMEFEVHYGGTKDYNKYVMLALKFKQVWLQETGRQTSGLSKEHTKQFLGGLTSKSETKPPEGAIVAVLMIDKNPIAIEIGFCLNGHYYSYLGAFDFSFRNFSPGKIQMEMLQEWAKSVGLSKYDFLGETDSYKDEWINSKTPIESRSFYFNFRGYLYSVFWIANIRPIIHTFYNNMSSKSRKKLVSFVAFFQNRKEN